MSITEETLKQHLKDPAIFCCRREKGLVISAADLEDPTLFDDMEEAGLLKLSPDGLKIEQVIGSVILIQNRYPIQYLIYKSLLLFGAEFLYSVVQKHLKNRCVLCTHSNYLVIRKDDTKWDCSI